MLAKPQGFPRKLGGCAGLDPRLRSAVSAGVGDGERGLRRGLRAPGVGVRPKWVLEYSPSNKRIRYFVSITYVRTGLWTAHKFCGGGEPFDAMEEAEPAEVVAALGPDTGTEPSPGEGHGSDTESGTDPGARGPDMTPLPSREPLAPAPAEPNGLFIDPGVWTAETPSVGISTSNGATVEPTPIPDLTAFGSIAASGPATTPTLALARSPAELLGLSVAPSEETTVDPVEFLGQTVIPIPTPQYTGEIITLDLVGVDVRDFFRLIGDLSGLNLILDPAVAGSLTITLRDVPWDQALDVVLRNFNLGYELQGNVLRVATAATLQAEEDARTTLRAAQDLNAQLVTRTFILSYTDSATVTPIVQDLLSPRGTIIQDARRNALIISDVPASSAGWIH